MAVEDVSFYNIKGEEVSRGILVQAMIDYYQEKLALGETKVTDFNEGSEIRNLIEGQAVQVYVLMQEEDDVSRICFVETADGEWLDKHGSNPLLKIPRELGQAATGTVTFSIPEATTSDVVVPIDTIVISEETGLEFATMSDAIIPVGDTSVTCLVECLTVGVDGNADTGTVTLFDDANGLYNGLTVTNTEPFTGGLDYEEDDDYRERLLAYERRDDFGSIGWYESICEAVNGVHDVLLVADATYTRKVLVNGDVKPTPDSVLADVLEVVTDTNNKVLNHTFTVDKPDYVTNNLTVNLEVSSAVSEDDINELLSAVFDGGEALNGLIFDGMSIGQTLTKSALYGAFEVIDAVESVTITISSTEIGDLTVDPDEVLKLGTVTINQTVVS
jgi:uncharacterized phage protein gp47/JayE